MPGSEQTRALARNERVLAAARREAHLPQRRFRLRELAPRRTVYDWLVEEATLEEVRERLLAGVDETTDQVLRVLPPDPQALGRLGGGRGVIAQVDGGGRRLVLGLRTGDGREIFAPALELELDRDERGVRVRGRIKREFPDSVVSILVLGFGALAFGGLTGMLMLLTFLWIPGAVALLGGAGLFVSSLGLAQIALRAVNVRDVHQGLVDRTTRALEAPSRAGYR